jgi:hypothetical protein
VVVDFQKNAQAFEITTSLAFGASQDVAAREQSAGMTNLNVVVRPDSSPRPAACAKLIRTWLDRSGLTWCFGQSELLRPKPVRRNARRVFALDKALLRALPLLPLTALCGARLRRASLWVASPARGES